VRKKLLVLSLLLISGVSAEEVPEVQVTATRVEVPVEHVGDDVDIITQEEIKKYGFTSIADVLKYVAGVHISSNGGWGKQTSVFMLGLDSRDILVLVDGIPVNDPSNPSGAANFEWLDLSNVERIEVLKGSQSSLYGSEAVAGVINIITKRPKKSKFSIDIEGGKYKTFKEKIYSTLKLQSGYFTFSGENFKTNGFSATNKKVGQYIFNPDNDPFHYTTGTVSFGYSLNENVRLTGSLLLKGGYNEYDEGRTDYDRYFANLGAEILSSENLLWEVKLANNEEVRKESWGGYYNGITRYLLVSPTYFFSEKTFLKGGFAYRQGKAGAVSFPNVNNKSYFIRSLFLEGHTEFYGLNLTAVARIDDHKEFGSHGTYKVSAAYSLDFTGTTFKAQYGTGFKAPTLSQLYGYYQSPTTVGNPDLDPEKSEGWTLGVVQKIPLFKGKSPEHQKKFLIVVHLGDNLKSGFLSLFTLQQFYGDIQEYCILALLPSYIEKGGSSLVYMTQKLIEKSQHKQSGFYLYNLEELADTLKTLDKKGQKVLLIGVSYALLDLIEKHTFNLKNTIVLETGGMKGYRKEMVKEEFYTILKKGFGLNEIHSEYGMTELLSQAYSYNNGCFKTVPWLKVLIRDINDPFEILPLEKSGGINIIDLANIYSCSFIATQDLGKIYTDGTFSVLGRFDDSDIRGCNLMVQ
jgi:vitamin B12 transporter